MRCRLSRLVFGVREGPASPCRSTEQTEWLRHLARHARTAGTATVLVVIPAGSNAVAAYYAWSITSISVEDAPTRVHKGAGRYRQPMALLARLGLSIEHESRGLGAGLLAEAIGRTAQLSAKIGCRGLLVHAETPQACDFHLHLMPEFESSPTDDLHLVLLMKDILRTLRA